MMIEPVSFEDNGWTVRYQPPDDPATARVILLLHGWTGDEKVMWIFTRNLAGRFWLFAPRAPLAAPQGGYAWLPHGDQWPKLQDFQSTSQDLLSAFDRWCEHTHVPLETRRQPVNLMGFSQGAAMALALTAFQPQRVGRVAALAGFLPRGLGEMGPENAFHGRSIYLAHGSKDEIVPIRMAYESVNVLTKAGAEVTFCESDVGHKLSLDCAKGLNSFFP